MGLARGTGRRAATGPRSAAASPRRPTAGRPPRPRGHRRSRPFPASLLGEVGGQLRGQGGMGQDAVLAGGVHRLLVGLHRLVRSAGDPRQLARPPCAPRRGSSPGRARPRPPAAGGAAGRVQELLPLLRRRSPEAGGQGQCAVQLRSNRAMRPPTTRRFSAAAAASRASSGAPPRNRAFALVMK